MHATVKTCSSSSLSYVNRPEKPLSSRVMIQSWPHMQIALCVSSMAKLPRSRQNHTVALTKGYNHENFNVLQLYISFAAPRRAANHPGSVLCSGRRHGHCSPATRRLYAAKLAHLKHARYQWWRYRSGYAECAVQKERPVLLHFAQEQWHHHQLYCRYDYEWFFKRLWIDVKSLERRSRGA